MSWCVIAGLVVLELLGGRVNLLIVVAWEVILIGHIIDMRLFLIHVLLLLDWLEHGGATSHWLLLVFSRTI